MNQKIETVLRFLVRPRTIIFLVALFNFVWFFAGSSVVYHLGSNHMSFCFICPWWWDWSFTNAASLSLFAAIVMLFSRRESYLAAMIFSGFAILQGILWITDGPSLPQSLSQRIEVYRESSLFNIWELLDIQYLLATIIFVMAAICLIKASVAKPPPNRSLP